MFRNALMSLALAGALMVSGSAYAADAAPAAAPAAQKIAVVDVQGLLEQSKAGKSIQAQLDKYADTYRDEFNKLGNDLADTQKKLEADAPTKQNTPEFQNRKKDFEAKAASANKQVQLKSQALQKARQDAVDQLRQEILKAVATIADQEKYNIVLTHDNVVIAEKSMDITDKVMEKLNKDLPDVKVKVEVPKDDAPAAKKK